jgi:hypothetical protein
MKHGLLLGLVIAVLFGAGVNGWAEQDHGPKMITLTTPLGVITFSHAEHQAKISDCNTCHHKGPAKGKCTGCHGADTTSPMPMKAFHDQCKGCHKDANGPMKCRQCHVK